LLVNITFPELREQKNSMAEKPSNKSRKAATSKQGTAQPKSTVTSIGQGSNSAETSKSGFQAVDQKMSGVQRSGVQRIEEEIRIRAYELFNQRGRQEGFHEDDWARAESEVLAKCRRDKSA
jgi:DUF2934 family protein